MATANIPSTRAAYKLGILYHLREVAHIHSIHFDTSTPGSLDFVTWANNYATIFQTLLYPNTEITGWQVHTESGLYVAGSAFYSPISGTRSVVSGFRESYSTERSTRAFGIPNSVGDIRGRYVLAYFPGYSAAIVGLRRFIDADTEAYFIGLSGLGAFEVRNKYDQAVAPQGYFVEKENTKIHAKHGF